MHLPLDAKWVTEHSDNFSVSNGVRQGGVILPLLFSCYIDQLFSQLQNSGLGCHVGSSLAGSFGYADDIVLVAPSMQYFKKDDLITVYVKSFKPREPKCLP